MIESAQEILVVMLDNPRFGGGPGTVVEVTCDPVAQILARYTDRDGARPAGLRLWRAHPSCEPVEPGAFKRAKLALGTGLLGSLEEV